MSNKPGEEEGGNGWQPIETAPKGCRSLLWSATLSWPVIEDWAHYERHNQPRFTHWMALPNAPGAAAAPAEQTATPEWMTCSSRAPWVANSLRSRAQELRGDEKRSRGAYQKDYMGAPTRYFADALGDAAAAIEGRLRVVEAARAAQAHGGKA